MKKLFALMLSLVLTISLLAGCGSNNSGSDAGSNSGNDSDKIRVGFIVGGKLGDNAANDACNAGMVKFSEESGIEVTTIEAGELQDQEINARAFAEDGYNLVVLTEAPSSELIAALAPDYPDTHFIIQEGTVADQPNVTCLRTRIGEAAFLTGAFNALMNQELGGEARGAFVGGVRNPNLERSQYGFTAGCEYVGGECSVVYVGNFTDDAKGKEIALQLYSDGLYLVQAFAGGAGVGVYQAAESLGDGYYSLGAATGQFNLSPSIIASQVKNMDVMLYNACNSFVAGTLDSGIIEVGLEDGSVGIKYAPDSDGKIPENVKEQIQELEDKLLSGELTAPATEDEYNAWAETYLN